MAQHVGNDTVRCIMLSPVRAWAAAWPSPPPARPSGPRGRGRAGPLFNVLDDAIDGGGPGAGQQR